MDWLTKDRIRVYPRLFVILFAVLYICLILSGRGIIDGNGKPIGSDFLGYYAASKIILAGSPTDVYNQVKLFSIEENISGIRYPLPVNYPPIYFLMIAPLSILPYLPALAIWLGSTLLLYLFVIYRISPHPATVWLTLSFSGTFQNFIHGQNGFLSAAILGAGLTYMDRFPFSAGIIFGFLTYKPHLAVLIPIALLAGRYWKVLAGMMTSTVFLILISSLVFGLESWFRFMNNIQYAINILQTSALPLYQMPTVFAAGLLAGFGPIYAKILHGITALTVSLFTIYLWYKKGPLYIRASALVIGIILLTPHANTHDLALLSIPLALIGWQTYSEERFPKNSLILITCWILPLFCVPIAILTKVQIAPLVLIIFFVIVFRLTKRFRVNGHSAGSFL